MSRAVLHLFMIKIQVWWNSKSHVIDYQQNWRFLWFPEHSFTENIWMGKPLPIGLHRTQEYARAGIVKALQSKGNYVSNLSVEGKKVLDSLKLAIHMRIIRCYISCHIGCTFTQLYNFLFKMQKITLRFIPQRLLSCLQTSYVCKQGSNHWSIRCRVIILHLKK